MSDATRATAHTRHMADECANVPDEISRSMMAHLDDVATAVSRDELADAIEAMYAAVGTWEDFLEEDGGSHA